MRSIVLMRIRGAGEQVLGDFLKYYPLAFWLTFDSPSTILVGRNIRELPVRGRGLDELAHVVINTQSFDVPHPGWPELVADDELLAFSGYMCYVSEQM